MNSLLHALTRFFGKSSTDAQDRDAAYLAQAVDIYDLERRMRQIDTGRQNLVSSGPYGIFMR
ncbi:MAG TPA: DUF3563 family protein [Caldimonas sp.]